MTYAISSALNRYDSGTATRLSLRAAWIVTSTSSEFGPHHTSRSPGCAPAGEQPVREPVHQRVELARTSWSTGGAPPDCVDDDRDPVAACSARARARASSGAFMESSCRCGASHPATRRYAYRRCLRSPDGRAFAVRGIVEGFYGTPWSHDARLDAISFLAPRGMNAYVYAPKDDAKHRADWRVPYDAGRAARSSASSPRTRDEHGARFGFAISPGLDIDYESRRRPRRAARQARSRCSTRASPWFLLAARRHPDAARPRAPPGRARDVAARASCARRAPTPRSRCARPSTSAPQPSPYLAELGAGLPPEVDVMWTGPDGVLARRCAPTTPAAGPTRSAGAARSCGTTRR